LQHVVEHLRRFSTSVVTSVMFGVRAPRKETPAYHDFWEVMEKWMHLTAPTSHPPIDIFPFLQKLPEFLAPWKAECREVREEKRANTRRNVAPVEKRIATGTENGSFMETIYKRAEEWNLDEECVQCVPSLFFFCAF
jgi:hypothetical protein